MLMLNLLYYTYGINLTDINTIYSINYHTLIDTGMKYLLFYFPQLGLYIFALKPGPEVIKLFFMLNSTEHEIIPAH